MLNITKYPPCLSRSDSCLGASLIVVAALGRAGRNLEKWSGPGAIKHTVGGGISVRERAACGRMATSVSSAAPVKRKDSQGLFLGAEDPRNANKVALGKTFFATWTAGMDLNASS